MKAHKQEGCEDTGGQPEICLTVNFRWETKYRTDGSNCFSLCYSISCECMSLLAKWSKWSNSTCQTILVLYQSYMFLLVPVILMCKSWAVSPSGTWYRSRYSRWNEFCISVPRCSLKCGRVPNRTVTVVRHAPVDRWILYVIAGVENIIVLLLYIVYVCSVRFASSTYISVHIYVGYVPWYTYSGFFVKNVVVRILV